jgi:hypothetical protein
MIIFKLEIISDFSKAFRYPVTFGSIKIVFKIHLDDTVK